MSLRLMGRLEVGQSKPRTRRNSGKGEKWAVKTEGARTPLLARHYKLIPLFPHFWVRLVRRTCGDGRRGGGGGGPGGGLGHGAALEAVAGCRPIPFTMGRGSRMAGRKGQGIQVVGGMKKCCLDDFVTV